MPQLWTTDNPEGWRDTQLTADGYAIRGTNIVETRPGFSSVPTLWRVDSRSREDQWVLVVPDSAVTVNGERVMGGVRILRHRDLIRIGGVSMFYSNDSNATIAALPDLGRKIVCPRCKKEIEAGKPTVRCPTCRTYHHQDAGDDRLCWTYGQKCSCCDHPTDLSIDSRWSPTEL